MPEIEIVLPSFKPKQQLVFDSRANEILFAGDTRAGKSFFVRRTYIELCASIPGLITDILRLNWADVIKNYMLGETSFPALLHNWEKAGLVNITEARIDFWNGSVITLGHCADERAIRTHQGNPTHVRTLDESAQLIEGNIRALGGWMTITKEFADKIPDKWKGTFPRLYHLTNFVGPGMGYYRRGFLECREPFEIQKVGQFNRQYIPAYLTDNDSEDASATIARIKEAFPDPMVQRALLECDWRAMAGDMFPEWNEDRHVVTDFRPPVHWFRFRSLDLGYAEPTAVYWCAVSDGEPFFDHDHNERWFPRGAFIIYNEWYVCDEREPSKGLRLRNEDIRDGVIERSELGHRTDITLTDSLPFQDRGGESVPSVFLNKGSGIVLTLGDTSRVVGWNQFRSRLIGIEIDLDGSGIMMRLPMIYFTESCRYIRQYVPMLQRHKSESKPEDAVEHGEATHSCDAIRLICMAHTIIKDKISPLESRIQKTLAQLKPTVNKIIKQKGKTVFDARI